MEKRIYHYLIVLISIIVIITSLVLSLLFIDIYNKGFDAELNISTLLLMILPAAVGLLVLILVFLYFISSKLTSSILKPIYIATQNIESILSGKEVQYEDSYEELNPFIKAIQIQKIEIEKSIMKLRDSEKYRREFTANVSHELKTPLTSINGYAEMISTGMTKEEDIIKFANIIHKEGTRLLGLIDSIINLSKLDSEDYSNAELALESVDIYKLSKTIVARLEHGALEKNIQLSLSGDSTIIKGNSRMLEDLISNLIDNAIKYNRQPGRVDISISKYSKVAKIKVMDTGIGIPEEDKNRVFERFYRVDKSRSKRINGTGIGLSIVKHIVEYHHGKITLISEVDKGTEIEIDLPM